jgi:FixJ family two-component response regulator
MADAIHIALIDDDEAVLDSLKLYFERQGIRTTCFSAALAFLAAKDIAGAFDCVVADVRMPGLSGLNFVRKLAAEGIIVPVILITGHGDVGMAVSAIKIGAFDFIEKPFDEKRLLDSVHAAIGHSQRNENEEQEFKELKSRVASLSERQRQVMELAAMGLSNKEIATRLCISPRTVEIHRAWMMERMGARNVADLVRMVMRFGDRSSQ